MLTISHTYNLTNLKLCYNRQLLNLGSIIQELASRNRYTIELFANVMLKHTTKIKRKEDYLIKVDQGNRFLDNLCQDASYLIIRDTEKKNLGTFFKNPARKSSH